MGNEFWFRPKTFGYGATPTAWQGWAVIAGYGLVVLGCVAAMYLRKESLATIASSITIMIVATIMMVVVSVQKTDGAWRWNWGATENSGKSE
jgi:uncharacterized membrane protein AbrB (regulator of aidB expression)